MTEAGLTEYRNGIRFGYGTYFRTEGTLPPQDQEVLEREVRLLGWSHACPIVTEVMASYGTENAFKRYSDCNRTFTETVRTLSGINWRLAYQLTQPTLKKAPVGKHEPESIPLSHTDEMAPLATPVGYAFPRLLLLHEENLRNIHRNPLEIALSRKMVVIDASRETEVPEQFLMSIAHTTYPYIAHDPKKVVKLFGHLFPTNVLDEENCLSEYEHLANVMDKISPNLRLAYLELLQDPVQMQNAGIIALR